MVTRVIEELALQLTLEAPLSDVVTPNASSHAVESKSGRSVGALVIEDDRLMLNAMEQGLRKRGFRVWKADDGNEGVELYRRFGTQIDVVLSDVQMPVQDGPKTLAALREINPAVRFCFMTGDARASTLRRLLQRGALRVFTKPLSSVAEVAEELWELATHPHYFRADCEPDDDVAAGVDCVPSCQQAPTSETGLIRRIFKGLVQAIVGRVDTSNQGK